MKRETRIGLGVGLLLILGFGLILSEVTNSDSPPPSSSDNRNSEYVATSRHVRPAGRPQMRIGEAVMPPPSYRRQARRQATQPAQPAQAQPAQDQRQQQRDRRVEAANVMLAATEPTRPARLVQTGPYAAGQGPPAPQFTEMDAPQLQAYVRHTAGAPTTQTYVVQAGDTLTDIARRFMGDGSWATVQKLYEMNGATLSDPDQLDIGMHLVVPAGRGRNN